MTESTDLSAQTRTAYTIVRIVAVIALLTALAAIAFAYSQAIFYWNDISV